MIIKYKRAIVLILMLCVSAFLSGCDMDREQGVQLHNNIDVTSLEHIKNNCNLQENEKPIAYYDSTLSMDGSNTFLLTNKRVGSYKGNNKRYILLTDIQKIEHKDKAFEFLIFVTATTGDKLIIKIDPLNGGDLFLAELQEQYNRINSK